MHKLRDLDCTVSEMPFSPILPFYPKRQIYLLFACRQAELGPITMPNLWLTLGTPMSLHSQESGSDRVKGKPTGSKERGHGQGQA